MQPCHRNILYVITYAQTIRQSIVHRFSLEILKQVRTKFNSMLQLGIILLTNLKWTSPLHVIKKSEGSYRPCGNY